MIIKNKRKPFWVSFGLCILFFANTLSQDTTKKYQFNNLTISQISKHVFVHTSTFKSQNFGTVPCNGMIVVNDKKAVVFDTPIDDTTSEALINWVTKHLQATIIAVIPTHFHQDCLGGLKAFHIHHIPSYAFKKTIFLSKKHHKEISKNSFDSSIIFTLGNKKVYAQFVGEGHTKDNIIGYFPDEHTMFGGCLIKELGAKKGNLEDANTDEWANSIQSLKAKYPTTKIVIPGHGQYGNQQLLDYTIHLFSKQ